MSITVATTMILAPPTGRPLLTGDSGLFLGKDFFPWMVLAFGAAMVVGNVLALVRPPAERRDGATAGRGSGDAADHPPVARAVTLIVVGLAASLWGIASLVAN